MKSKTIKKLYTLHSWVGVITGILLFVIAFTGAVSVFGRPEIKVWATPEVRDLPKVDVAKVQSLVEKYVVTVPEHYKEEVLIFLPGTRSYKNLAIIFESHSGQPEKAEKPVPEGEAEPEHHSPPVGKLYEFDPYTYELVKEQEGLMEEIFESRYWDMSDFIVGFHADLHMGRPIGLLTTGVLGLTMMLSIVTGIFIHRKILGQLFTFRPRKNLSLMLNDGHKVIGVWGLLFNSVIAFTGAFLGLALVVLVPAAAFVSFGGDQEKLIETFTAMPDPVIQHVEQSTQVAKIIEGAYEIHADTVVNSVVIKGIGDASAMAYASISGGDSVAGQTAVFNGATGEFEERYSNFERIGGFTGVILDVMFPLHFGNFGGVLVKAIWAVLGLGTALLPLTGLMLWMERGVNAANPKYSMKTYQRFNRLIVGGCGGIVVATLFLFPTQMYLKFFTDFANVGPKLWWPFFGSWIAVVLWAMFSPCEKKTAKHITYLCAILLMSIMPMDAILTGSHVFNVLSTGHYINVGIDVVTFIMGVYMWLAVNKFTQLKAQSATANEPVSAPLEEAL
ncbi:PepSY-associated TM helix domain-containing protein [Thalassotalea euphylliae]|uniref:PepSY-associated TM helix domain-containing protein n=1 Tax=Thalassotalea euphylliae TaxID=1655234 RepID=UPI003624D0B0